MADDFTNTLPLVSTVTELLGNQTVDGVTSTVRIPRANVTNGASPADLNALKAQTITGAGLAVGGGDLSASRVITVTKASAAEVTAGARDDVVVTPAGNLAALNTRVAPVEAGIEQVNTHPNVWTDPKFAQAASPHSALVMNGHDCVKILGGLQGWRIPRSALGTDTTYSFSMWIEAISITGTVGNNDVIVYQEDAAQAEIAGTRQVALNVGLGVSSTPFALPPVSNAAIDANCVSFFVRLRASTAGNYLIASRPLLAGGASAAYRAPQPDITVNGAAYDELIRTGADVDQLEPNVFVDPFFNWLTARAGYPALWSVAASGVLTTGTARNRRSVIITTGNVTVKTPAKALGGPGAYIAGSITIENVVRASGSVNVYLQQFDSAGAEISAARIIVAGGLLASTAEQRFDFTGQLDASCDSVGFFVSAGSVSGNSVEFSRLMLAQGKQKGFRQARVRDRRIIYLDPAGSDAASGSPEYPVASPQRAMLMLTRPDNILAGEIVITGDHTMGRFNLGYTGQGINAPVVGDLCIRAASNARARLIHGTPFAGVSWTKTAGQTNVYEATIAFNPTAKFIFEHETAFGLISISERFPQHRGRQYRCPSWPLRKATSLANCDATPGTWWYASGKLYIHAPGSADPTANGKTYYAPPNVVTNLASGFNYGSPKKTGYLESHGIQVWYGYSGFQLTNVAKYRLSECVAIGSTTVGFAGWNSSGERLMCEAIANSQDGFNDHDSTALEAASYRDQSAVDRFLYAALNGDDGWSNHERSNANIQDCLSEYNDDGGFLPAGGAHLWASHCIAHKNGVIYPAESSGGEGFGNRGGPDGNEGGVSTDMTLMDCVAIGNTVNFSSGAGSAEQMRAVRPVSIDPVNTHYQQGGTSTMTLIDPRYSGAGTAKVGTPTITSTTGLA